MGKRHSAFIQDEISSFFKSKRTLSLIDLSISLSNMIKAHIEIDARRGQKLMGRMFKQRIQSCLQTNSNN